MLFLTLIWCGFGGEEGRRRGGQEERGGLLFLAACVAHTPDRALRVTKHLGQGDIAYDQRVAGEAALLASGHGGWGGTSASVQLGLGNPFVFCCTLAYFDLAEKVSEGRDGFTPFPFII